MTQYYYRAPDVQKNLKNISNLGGGPHICFTRNKYFKPRRRSAHMLHAKYTPAHFVGFKPGTFCLAHIFITSYHTHITHLTRELFVLCTRKDISREPRFHFMNVSRYPYNKDVPFYVEVSSRPVRMRPDVGVSYAQYKLVFHKRTKSLV